MTDELELTLTQTIHAPREAVFNAWLEPEMLAEFIRPAPNMSIPVAETDPRVGGAYKIVMRAGETDLLHHGEYKEIKKYDRLVFSWLSDFTRADSLVTLTFRALSENETEVTLHHVGFPSEDSRNNHEGGWKSILQTQAEFMKKAA